MECSGVKLAGYCGGENTGKRRSWYAEAEKVFDVPFGDINFLSR